MDEAAARRLLGAAAGSDRSQVEAAFRTQAFRLHPDRGGDLEAFQRIVEARDALLAFNSVSAPAGSEPEISAESPADRIGTARTVGRRAEQPSLVYAVTLMVLRRRNARRAAERRRAGDGPRVV